MFRKIVVYNIIFLLNLLNNLLLKFLFFLDSTIVKVKYLIHGENIFLLFLFYSDLYKKIKNVVAKANPAVIIRLKYR